MKYKVKNVTLNIDTTDGDFTGDCIVYIPFAHKEFFKECCVSDKNENFTKDAYEYIWEHEYGEVFINKEMKCYYSSSADLLISYISWLFDEGKEVEVNVEYQNAFWAIHDMEHAQNDEAGCSIYVDADIELQRLKDAFELFIKEGYELTYDLVQEVEEAYNTRFGAMISFEEYLYQEEYDEEYV